MDAEGAQDIADEVAQPLEGAVVPGTAAHMAVEVQVEDTPVADSGDAADADIAETAADAAADTETAETSDVEAVVESELRESVDAQVEEPCDPGRQSCSSLCRCRPW